MTVRAESSSTSLDALFNLLKLLNVGVSQRVIAQPTIMLLADLWFVKPEGLEDLSAAAHVALVDWVGSRPDEIGNFTIEGETEGIKKSDGSFTSREVGSSVFLFAIRVSIVGTSEEDVLFILFDTVEAFLQRADMGSLLALWVLVNGEVEIRRTVRFPDARVGSGNGWEVR